MEGKDIVKCWLFSDDEETSHPGWGETARQALADAEKRLEYSFSVDPEWLFEQSRRVEAFDPFRASGIPPKEWIRQDFGYVCESCDGVTFPQNERVHHTIEGAVVCEECLWRVDDYCTLGVLDALDALRETAT